MKTSQFCIVLLLTISAAALAAVCKEPITPGTVSATTWRRADSTSFYDPYPCSLLATNFGDGADAGQLDLTIQPCGDCSHAYSCALGSSPTETGFGFYNCDMKVSGVSGTVTSCIAESGVNSPYENAYIKFFGNETSRVHVGFFTQGRVQQAGPIQLNFDPTLDFHTYSIELTTNYIKFYIDGGERSSDYGSRQLPVAINRFTVSYVTEDGTTNTDNSAYFTQYVNRVFDGEGESFTTSFRNISFNPQAFNDGAGNDCAGFNPSPTPESNDECSVEPKPLPIFTESADNDWKITATNSKISDETAQVRNGVHAIGFTIFPGAILEFTAPASFESTEYYGVEFWINGGAYGNQQIYVSAVLAGGERTTPFPIVAVLTGMGGLSAGIWIRLVLPFTAFGLAPGVASSVSGFEFTFPGAANGGLDAGRTFFLDDVYLVAEFPMCANSTSYIYQDGLAQGVADQSYGGRYSLSSDAPVYSGSYAIHWDMYAYDGLKFHFSTAYNTDQWEGVSFRINLLSMTGRQWSMYFTSPDSTAEGQRAGAAPLNLIEYFLGVNPPGSWPLVTIPFRHFGIGSGQQIDGIVFQCNSNDYQGSISLDNLAVISTQSNREDPLSTTTSAASATVVFTSALTVLAVSSLYLL